MTLRPNIKQCCDLLDLQPGFTLEDLKQAYKDLAQVWHPDRFSHNPRLQQKAEDKLKQINAAYAQLEQFIKQRQAAQAVASASTAASARTAPTGFSADVPTGMPKYPINDAARLRLQLSALLIAAVATFGSLFGIILFVYLVAKFTPFFVALLVLAGIYGMLRWISDRQT
jgi:curved DNA-binding protein CbpA